jgi:hypothetical protein
MNPMIKKVILGAGALVVGLGVTVGKRILRREARVAAAVGVVATVDAAAQAIKPDSSAPAAATPPPSAPPPTVSAPAATPMTQPKQAAEAAVAAANARTVESSTMPADSSAPAQQTAAAIEAESMQPPATRTDSAAGKAEVKSAGAQFERETFMYDRGGRRDPFISLMSTSDLRPLISDLRLVAVAFDPNGRNSVAVLHDVSTKEKQQYRIRTGQSLGRMRVSSITPRSVVFTIEEFGYSRQETLALGDSNTERKQ